MFCITAIEDDVKVSPQDLGLPTYQAVTAEIDRTFSDKILHDVGLVIAVYQVRVYVGQGDYVFANVPSKHCCRDK